jgi:hypothetical protein
VTTWKELGAPAYLNPEDRASLNAANFLTSAKCSQFKINSTGQNTIELNLNGTGVALVEIF